MVTIELPVKPYIRNYLEVNFGKPVKLTRESHVGKFFFLLTESTSRRHDKKYSPYKDRVNIVITENAYLRNGSLITPTGIMDFNNFMEDLIKIQLFTYIDALRESSTINLKSAFERYRDKFEIDESSFSYENIKKTYYRYTRRTMSQTLISK